MKNAEENDSRRLHVEIDCCKHEIGCFRMKKKMKIRASYLLNTLNAKLTVASIKTVTQI